MKMNIRASYDSFRDLRENDAYYIDKTAIIEEYLIDRFEKAVLFARPRRFGKTLTMTMFRNFLDIRQDSRDIFSGLKIMDSPDVVRNFMIITGSRSLLSLMSTTFRWQKLLVLHIMTESEI